jgi:hypothetical protein
VLKTSDIVAKLDYIELAFRQIHQKKNPSCRNPDSLILKISET